MTSASLLMVPPFVKGLSQPSNSLPIGLKHKVINDYLLLCNHQPEGARRLVPGQKKLCLIPAPVCGETLLAESDPHGRALLLPPGDHPQGPNISPETVAASEETRSPNVKHLVHDFLL